MATFSATTSVLYLVLCFQLTLTLPTRTRNRGMRVRVLNNILFRPGVNEKLREQYAGAFWLPSSVRVEKPRQQGDIVDKGEVTEDFAGLESQEMRNRQVRSTREPRNRERKITTPIIDLNLHSNQKNLPSNQKTLPSNQKTLPSNPTTLPSKKIDSVGSNKKTFPRNEKDPIAKDDSKDPSDIKSIVNREKLDTPSGVEPTNLDALTQLPESGSTGSTVTPTSTTINDTPTSTTINDTPTSTTINDRIKDLPLDNNPSKDNATSQGLLPSNQYNNNKRLSPSNQNNTDSSNQGQGSLASNEPDTNSITGYSAEDSIDVGGVSVDVDTHYNPPNNGRSDPSELPSNEKLPRGDTGDLHANYNSRDRSDSSRISQPHRVPIIAEKPLSNPPLEIDYDGMVFPINGRYHGNSNQNGKVDSDGRPNRVASSTGHQVVQLPGNEKPSENSQTAESTLPSDRIKGRDNWYISRDKGYSDEKSDVEKPAPLNPVRPSDVFDWENNHGDRYPPNNRYPDPDDSSPGSRAWSVFARSSELNKLVRVVAELNGRQESSEKMAATLHVMQQNHERSLDSFRQKLQIENQRANRAEVRLADLAHTCSRNRLTLNRVQNAQGRLQVDVHDLKTTQASVTTIIGKIDQDLATNINKRNTTGASLAVVEGTVNDLKQQMFTHAQQVEELKTVFKELTGGSFFRTTTRIPAVQPTPKSEIEGKPETDGKPEVVKYRTTPIPLIPDDDVEGSGEATDLINGLLKPTKEDGKPVLIKPETDSTHSGVMFPMHQLTKKLGQQDRFIASLRYKVNILSQKVDKIPQNVTGSSSSTSTNTDAMLQKTFVNLTNHIVELQSWRHNAIGYQNNTRENSGEIEALQNELRTVKRSLRNYSNDVNTVAMENDDLAASLKNMNRTLRKLHLDFASEASENAESFENRIRRLRQKYDNVDNRLSHVEVRLLNRSLEACSKANKDMQQDLRLRSLGRELSEILQTNREQRKEIKRLKRDSEKIEHAMTENHQVVGSLVGLARNLTGHIPELLGMQTEVNNFMLHLPKDCSEEFGRGTRKSGSYLIKPRGAQHSVQTYCQVLPFDIVNVTTTEDNDVTINVNDATNVNNNSGRDNNVLNTSENVTNNMEVNATLLDYDVSDAVNDPDVTVSNNNGDLSKNDANKNLYLSNDKITKNTENKISSIKEKHITLDGKSVWTVIQRRFYNSEEFDRSWKEYQLGFGDTRGDFWMGNQAIFLMTSSEPYELLIEMWDLGGEYWYAYYETFYLEDEHTAYTLRVANYSGNATDALADSNSMGFSTSEFDHDKSSTHCAKFHKSGWWYRHCHSCNLNGRFDIGMIWFNNEQDKFIQMQRTRMTIRPQKRQSIER